MKATEALKQLADKITTLIEREKEVGEEYGKTAPLILNDTISKRFAYAEVKLLITDMYMQQPLGD